MPMYRREEHLTNVYQAKASLKLQMTELGHELFRPWISEEYDWQVNSQIINSWFWLDAADMVSFFYGFQIGEKRILSANTNKCIDSLHHV